MRIPERSLEPPEEVPMPRCPICGEECEKLFLDTTGAVVGCESCVEIRNAYENRHLAD